MFRRRMVYFRNPMEFLMRMAISNVVLLAISLPTLAYGSGLPTSWRKSALNRPGLHHVTITGRFISPEGHPVPGVRVHVETGDPRSLPVEEAVSGADGRFRLSDVNTYTTAGLRWYPPDGWTGGAMVVSGSPLGSINIGAIQLEPSTVVRAVVELVGGPPFGTHPPTISVSLEGAARGQRVAADEVNGLYVLSNIPFRKGRWSVTLSTVNRIEHYEAPASIEPGSRNRLLLLRLLRDKLKNEPFDKLSYEGKIEVHEAMAPERSFEREFRAQGRLLAPDGSPIHGAVAGMIRFLGIEKVVPAWAFSDREGKFDLRYRALECRNPVFLIGSPSPWYFGPADDKEPCEQTWAASRDVVIEDAVQLILKPSGIDHSEVQAFWWRPPSGWQPFHSLQPWVAARPGENRLLVALVAEKWLPVVREVVLPVRVKPNDQSAPAKVEVEFPFTRDVVRSLAVLEEDDSPFANSIIDLELISDLAADRRIPLGSFRTDGAGNLKLLGEPQQMVEAFVYAAHAAPARFIWNPGVATQARISSRRGTVMLGRIRPGSIARIQEVRPEGPARTLRVTAGEGPHFNPPPGKYDIVVQDSPAAAPRLHHVHVKAGEIIWIDSRADRHPTLVVRFPDDGWSASVSEAASSGMVYGWTIYSTIGGGYSARNVCAMLEKQTRREAVFRLLRTGKLHVELHRAGLNYSLWREIEAAPNETITLDAPQGGAVLRGSMRTYDGGKGYSHHGWAGPRMELIAVDPSAWSVTVHMPPREGEHGFLLTDLPPGSYFLHQHLIGVWKSFKGASGEEMRYTEALHAWGGIPIALTTGQTTVLKDFIEYPFQDMSVTVLYADGSPVNEGLVRVRDRMSDAWRQIAEGPTTLKYASHPIPYPPAVRIRNARAVLPSIRAGRLDFQIELDDGVVYAFSRDVDPTEGITVKLPVSRSAP